MTNPFAWVGRHELATLDLMFSSNDMHLLRKKIEYMTLVIQVIVDYGLKFTR